MGLLSHKTAIDGVQTWENGHFSPLGLAGREKGGVFVMHGFQNGQKMWNFDVGSSMGDRHKRITPLIAEMGWIFWDTKGLYNSSLSIPFCLKI